jgi:hypothetical protein
MRKISKLILKELEERIWVGLIWLRIWANARLMGTKRWARIQYNKGRHETNVNPPLPGCKMFRLVNNVVMTTTDWEFLSYVSAY